MGLFMQSPWDNGKKHGTQKNKIDLNFDNWFGKFSYEIFFIFLLGLLFLWLASGVYQVKEGEEAIITRFGQFVRKASPGLNFHLPSPIEVAYIERVNQSRRIEIGYRSNIDFRSNVDSNIQAESIMLTGDENIVNLNCDVMWHIHNLENFVFNIDNPEYVVKSSAESAIREVIGNTPISSVLSNQKQEIADKIEILTQKILDHYAIGVQIEKVQLLKAEPPLEVIDAYRDVQTSRADKEKEINLASSYHNDIIPRARGEAVKIIQEAEAYKGEVISKAEGDTKRFLSILYEYNNNKSVTKDRLYFETAEIVLMNGKKIIVNANTGLLPHIQLDTKTDN